MKHIEHQHKVHLKEKGSKGQGRGPAQGRILSKQGPVQKKMWGPSLIYEYRPTEFTRHAQ